MFLNGNRYQFQRIFFALIDTLLVFAGLVLGVFVRLYPIGRYSPEIDYLAIKIMIVVCIVQVSFYYFDLHDFRVFSERKKMVILLLGSLGISLVILSFIYYLVPWSSMGRGILAIGFGFIPIFALLWRLSYARWSNSRTTREKVLIVGTGELARRIKHEITENGYDGFEIIGFIDEKAEQVGTRV
jgi:FlaA1/EpsC-like NDP-sugar epimerase